MIDLDGYKSIQCAAKQVLAELGNVIEPASTEQSIAAFSARRLSELGFPNTWYYDCPAFVLAGNRSCLSISGRDYLPSTKPFGRENLVSVDLSPSIGKFWGDCARSFAIEDGSVAMLPSRLEFRKGFEIQARLHLLIKEFAKPETRFSELHDYANDLITSWGYVNLDFHGNVGHSIETSRENRVYIDASNHSKLATVPLFTFEPHIRKKDGEWGFKHENIYYFGNQGDLEEL